MLKSGLGLQGVTVIWVKLNDIVLVNQKRQIRGLQRLPNRKDTR